MPVILRWSRIVWNFISNVGRIPAGKRHGGGYPRGPHVDEGAEAPLVRQRTAPRRSPATARRHQTMPRRQRDLLRFNLVRIFMATSPLQAETVEPGLRNGAGAILPHALARPAVVDAPMPRCGMIPAAYESLRAHVPTTPFTEQHTFILATGITVVLALASAIGLGLKITVAKRQPHGGIDNLNTRVNAWWAMAIIVGLALAGGARRSHAAVRVRVVRGAARIRGAGARPRRRPRVAADLSLRRPAAPVSLRRARRPGFLHAVHPALRPRWRCPPSPRCGASRASCTTCVSARRPCNGASCFACGASRTCRRSSRWRFRATKAAMPSCSSFSFSSCNRATCSSISGASSPGAARSRPGYRRPRRSKGWWAAC